METDVWLEIEDTLAGEDVRDGLALSRVGVSVAGVGESLVDGLERVVEITFEGSVSVGVDD